MAGTDIEPSITKEVAIEVLKITLKGASANLKVLRKAVGAADPDEEWVTDLYMVLNSSINRLDAEVKAIETEVGR